MVNKINAIFNYENYTLPCKAEMLAAWKSGFILIQLAF